MQALRKATEKQPNLPWLIGSALVSLVILVAIVMVTLAEPVQVEIPVLHPSDWVLAIGMGIAVPTTLLTYWALQFFPQPKPRPQEPQEPMQEQRVILVREQGATPELVNRLRLERDEWKRKAEERPEPERALTYAAVVALLAAGNVGIKRGREIVRDNGGMVGRDYSELQELLARLPSPTARDATVHAQKQAVDGEREPVNQPVNPRAMGRSQPRRARGAKR